MSEASLYNLTWLPEYPSERDSEAVHFSQLVKCDRVVDEHGYRREIIANGHTSYEEQQNHTEPAKRIPERARIVKGYKTLPVLQVFIIT